jgi:hypothetical protein
MNPRRHRILTSRGTGNASQTFKSGMGIGVLYLVTVLISLHQGWIPYRIFYDNVTLLPYHWARPPQELAKGNVTPVPGRATVPFGPSGSHHASVTTDDGQATVVFDENAVAPRVGESSVMVSLTPVDRIIIFSAPSGMRFDSNLYRIDAVYAPSRRSVMLRRPASVVLRYVTGATEMVWFSGAGWKNLQTTRYAGGLQVVVARTPWLGTFAAVISKDVPYPIPVTWTWWKIAIVAAALVLALVVGFEPLVVKR